MTMSLICFTVLALSQIPPDVPPELLNAPEQWLELRAEEIDHHVALLSNAYELDDDFKDNLRKELWQGALQLRNYEQIEQQEFVRLRDLTVNADEVSREDAIAEANKRLFELSRDRPMRRETLAKWVEERVPPERAQSGRIRLQELERREQQVNAIANDDAERSAGRRNRVSAERIGKDAIQAVGGQPMPSGRKGYQAELLDQEQRQQAHIVPAEPAQVQLQPVSPAMPSQPGRPAAAATPASPVPSPQMPRPAEPVYAPAPPLDDWDKYVADVSGRYHFDEAQRTNAQSILQDLRRRASQYRMSRADQFAKAETMKDQKARSDTMRTLSRPIDALFDELKARLESLPTVEQKQRSTQGNQPAGKRRR